MPDRVELLGGAVDLVNQDEVMDFIAGAVATGRKAIVGNQNLHSLYLCRKDPTMSAFFAAADLIEIDSMPLLFWGRLLGLNLSRAHRCTYLDWRDSFWRLASERKWRVFCLGAAAEANAEALVRLKREWPGVRLDGHDGYFDHSARSNANAAVLEKINRFGPDVLLVGMGMPLQETWICENYDALTSGVMLSVGAAFDYEAGAQRAAPRIYGDLGFEWLYRLAHEPRRLFHRYMIEPWSLVGLAARDLGRRGAGNRPARPRTTRLVLEEWEIAEPVPGAPPISDDLRSAA
jgi:N-acetylglucosaminyldiphosphoundecaprenol N-acetyl-beta-D-mannosaminyltransferase